MPSGAEFRLAASRLDDLAADLTTLGRAVSRSGAVEAFDGDSRVVRAVERGIDAAEVGASSARSGCETLAGECRRRADVCDAYDDALRRFQTANIAWLQRRRSWLDAQSSGTSDEIVRRLRPGPRPTRPTPPDFHGPADRLCW